MASWEGEGKRRDEGVGVVALYSTVRTHCRVLSPVEAFYGWFDCQF